MGEGTTPTFPKNLAFYTSSTSILTIFYSISLLFQAYFPQAFI